MESLLRKLIDSSTFPPLFASSSSKCKQPPLCDFECSEINSRKGSRPRLSSNSDSQALSFRILSLALTLAILEGMVNSQARPPRARSSAYSPPIPSPLHGRFPPSTLCSPRPLPSTISQALRPPLSPKSQAIRPQLDGEERGNESITQLSFPPPLKRHAHSLLPSAADLSSESENEFEWEMREEVFVGEWKIGQSLGQGTSGSLSLSSLHLQL